MNSYRLLFSALLICLVSSCRTGSPTAADLPHPNILWITCEDISPNLGCYGDAFAYTPHLDRLATEGVLFTQGFASAPVCAVARSGIITGLYASSQGTQHMRCAGRLPEGVFPYPHYLREAGYFCSNNVKTDFNLDIDDKAVWDACSNTAHWRDRPDTTQPFFSIFNFTTSHEFKVNEEDTYLKAVEDVDPAILKQPGEAPLPPYYPDTEAVRKLWARYYNIITAMDQQVGEVLQQLEEDGLAENTIVFFYSDHGAGIPRHKRWLYDSGLRVPWMVRVPEAYRNWLPQTPGSTTDELVSFVDLAPTALHLAGIPVPAHMQGRAFMGPDLSPPRDYLHAGRDRMDERYDMQRAVRDKQFKYVRYYEPFKPFCQYMNTPEKGEIMQAIRSAAANGTLPEAGLHIVRENKPAEELFDLSKDPDELHNLADNPDYAAVLARMRTAHDQWSDETMDTGLIPETILRSWEKQYDASIYDIMRRESVPVREIRETALGQKTDVELVAALSHQNEGVRYWAAIQLGNQIESVQDLQPLRSALEDAVPAVRMAAARAICMTAQPQAGLAVLDQALSHEDEWVRLSASIILDEMGETAQPSVAALTSVMQDPNKYVVRVANHALNQLQGTTNEVP